MLNIEEQIHALLAYFQTGGAVMIPLLFTSFWVWLLIANRWFYLWKMNQQQISSKEALQRIKNEDIPTLEAGGIVGVLVGNFITKRSGSSLLDRRVLDEALLISRRPLKKYLSLIGILAAMTPLLGLLGTVTGMMNTFEVMSLYGTGDAKGMASGISEALITTETGLIIAIPALYMKNVLEQRAQRLEQRLISTSYYLRRHLCCKEV